jgi:Flp pilus assembly protein TadD
LLALLATLAACGSTPAKKDAPAAAAPPAASSAVTTAPATSPSVTAPEITKQANQPPTTKPSSKVSKSAPAETATAAVVTEAPVPPEAMQQFDNAVNLMGSGNTAAAEQAFRSLGSAYPSYSGALLNLGILQAKAGKLEDAQKTLQSAIERKADNAAAYNQLGIVYRRLGRFQDADQAYQKAIQIDPNYAIAHLNLGVLCDLYLQQPQRALESYERYLQLATPPDAKVSSWVTELKARLGNEPRNARAQ